MRKWLMCATGALLAGGLAFAQQEPVQDEYPQEAPPSDEWEQQDPATTDDPIMGEEDPYQTESQDPASQMEMPHSVADMSAEELQGLTIVTQTGEEVGEVDRVGHSEQDQERVATVDVGGFLGVGARTIAIPLSELEMTSDGRLQTSLTRESIETQSELDEQGFTEEGEAATEESQDY